jgi:two-component system KDP operon response regulator KdpE
MPGPNPVVVVVTDGPQLRRFLRASLRGHGFQVFEADTASRSASASRSRESASPPAPVERYSGSVAAAG